MECLIQFGYLTNYRSEPHCIAAKSRLSVCLIRVCANTHTALSFGSFQSLYGQERGSIAITHTGADKPFILPLQRAGDTPYGMSCLCTAGSNQG